MLYIFWLYRFWLYASWKLDNCNYFLSQQAAHSVVPGVVLQ